MEKETNKLNLNDLGYNDFFNNHYNNRNDKDLTLARIIAEHKEMYILRNETSLFSARVTGKIMFTALSREDYPSVGDWVLIKPTSNEEAIIHEILPRKTVLKRKSANNSDIQIISSNIDKAFIIQSTDRDYSLNRFERYVTISESEKIEPVLILNKIDLISEIELETILNEINIRFPNYEIYTTSTLTGFGISDLQKSIQKGLTYCFLGSSGVGKSSIINTILGENLIKTAEISSLSNRGKHITTHRELFILENNGILIDNPGMREIGILDSSNGIQSVFSEMFNLSTSCKYLNCSHTSEPGCAVLEAVSSGEIDKNKFDNYIRLKKENEHNTMSKLEKREKNKKFGKFIKTAKKQIKKYKYL